jgi:hypothetical protein
MGLWFFYGCNKFFDGLFPLFLLNDEKGKILFRKARQLSD